MHIKYSKLSQHKIKKIIKCFSIDLTATQTSKILGFNRKTINRYYKILRDIIFDYQNLLVSKWKKIEWRHRIKVLDNIEPEILAIYKNDGSYFTEILGQTKTKQVLEKCKKLKSLAKSKNNKLIEECDYEGLVNLNKNRIFCYKSQTSLNQIINFWNFINNRLRKFNGIKKQFPLHLKECEFRYGKSNELIEKTLLTIISKKKSWSSHKKKL